MAVKTNRSPHPRYVEPSTGFDSATRDGCMDAPTLTNTVPRRGRLDKRARQVVVTTRFAGTLVLQRINFNQYEGIVAQLRTVDGLPDSDPVVDVVMRHKDGANSIALVKNLPIDDAVAVWRSWADQLSMPLLLATETGEDSIVRDMLGAVLVKTAQARRARVLAGRRPRYAKRRGKR